MCQYRQESIKLLTEILAQAHSLRVCMEVNEAREDYKDYAAHEHLDLIRAMALKAINSVTAMW